jgi:hypothetical protein
MAEMPGKGGLSPAIWATGLILLGLGVLWLLIA